MADQRLLNILNDSIARELAAITQYMWQHIMAKGLESAEIEEIFKKVSMDEMRHAKAFAERLDYLGGVPSTKPTEIKVGGDVRQMLRNDVAAERDAIALYKRAVKLCQEIEDPVSRLLYEETLTKEEEHDYIFSTLLAE